ncbi:hypothetical protein BC941DRAFT_177622 [Chlamydoabsidia padenii]|nr:hypothetical protein BC941DRAFT_177622 [Chlamydoabsidia padenii]
MKDMSTTDKSSTDTLDEAMIGDSQEDDHTMGTNSENGDSQQQLQHSPDNSDKDSSNVSPSTDTNNTSNADKPIDPHPSNNSINSGNQTAATAKAFSQFGSKNNGDTDDWSEFADDNEEEDKPTTPSLQNDNKPKYTFGSSSGFGTKGWASAHQTTPTPTQKSTSFSGLSGTTFGSSFGSSSSGLGSFGSSSSQTSATKSTSAFGAFANAPTSSPFAMAAANGTTNALSSLPKITTPSSTSAALSPGDSTSSSVTGSDHQDGQENNNTDDQQENKDKDNAETEHTFGEASKIKVPGVKQTKVHTGEEDEDTIYQTKAKLLVLDSNTNNWKERGSGTFRINVKELELDGRTTCQARLVMRADSVYRLILNLLLFAEMKVFIMQDRFVRFAGFESETKEDGTLETKLVNYALKVANPSAAQELYHQITSRIPSKGN